ncbi:MAG: hypothetical protein SFW36_00910 [Leptolyngbyaceae cyanobacterium bins.59]|nr:hypothetical protein [Leptolyngbyaceae cyanobacterium bins.59]
MAQASFQWQQLLEQWTRGRSLPGDRLMLPDLSSVRWKEPLRWMAGSAAVTALLCWNWKIPVSTGAGILVMVLAYRWQSRDWQTRLMDFRKLVGGSSQPLALSVAAGMLATLTTYLSAALWTGSHDRSLAAALILQGFGILAILLMLVRQGAIQRSHQQSDTIDQSLEDLSHPNPVKRLVAVRQLTRLLHHPPQDILQRSTIADCFHLMVVREEEMIVRNAVLDGLRVLGDSPRLGQGRSPFVMSERSQTAAIKPEKVMTER